MVVVSGSWVKKVASYPASITNDEMVISGGDTPTMGAKALLICRPNSHPFQERTLLLDQPIKVGRLVARAKPTATNAIFDCKVLSRHHALLSYENGTFLLQDTNSSNGTFVNNTRLAVDEKHEVCSGDIVQFGVDVLENNRKVTHGCIIATLRLYLPDGKEAKTSPSIAESVLGMVPMDDLYRLNKIIHEANQREQCLATKLTALQNLVEDTRKSAAETWQAYVGEERLLSRLSALENQLQQNSKNWSDERLRDEHSKMHELIESYQIAAKEALEKVHLERLQAIATATEQERARISAEQEALLAKEHLEQIQLELEEVVTKLRLEQEKFERREKDLLIQLDSETSRVMDLKLKLMPPRITNTNYDDELERASLICNDDCKFKEDMLAQNDADEMALNKSNGVDQNHISLTVGPVDMNSNEESNVTGEMDDNAEISVIEENWLGAEEEEVESKEKRVNFKLPEQCEESDEANPNCSSDMSEDTAKETYDKDEKDDYNTSEHTDSKTLKYQYQSAQNELKRKIDLLESMSNASKQKLSEMEKTLNDQKAISVQRLQDNISLKQEFVLMQQKCKESANESQQLKDKLTMLSCELEDTQGKLQELRRNRKEEQNASTNTSLVSFEQMVNLEEELVMLKERFAKVVDEKMKMQRDLVNLTDQYNLVCNKSSNKVFFYIAPLILMVLYLLISQMIS